MKGFDIFRIEKEKSFHGSVSSITSLSGYFCSTSQNSDITKFIEFALWGNQCDLSLFFNAADNDISSLQTSTVLTLENMKKDIIVNDSVRLLDHLNGISSNDSTLIIILDNAGFELFTDLMLSYVLIKAKIFTKVIFEMKYFPWFVSDTTPSDFNWTLEACKNLNDPFLSILVDEWRSMLSLGIFEIRANEFWTTPYSFWEMPNKAPQLFEQLSEVDLVIFKGDLVNISLIIRIIESSWETQNGKENIVLRKALDRCVHFAVFVVYEHVRAILFPVSIAKLENHCLSRISIGW